MRDAAQAQVRDMIRRSGRVSTESIVTQAFQQKPSPKWFPKWSDCQQESGMIIYAITVHWSQKVTLKILGSHVLTMTSQASNLSFFASRSIQTTKPGP